MDWKDRVRSVFQGSEQMPDDDVLEELAQHARAMHAAARADGSSADEADRLVDDLIERWRVEAGGLRRTSARLPAVEPPPAAPASRFTGLTQDVRYAARVLRRQPRYALLATLTMALGIGAAATLFSVAYGVLMKRLPWPDAERVVVLKETRGVHAPRFGSMTNAAYLAWRDKADTIEDIGAWSQRNVTLAHGGEPVRVRVTLASAGVFRILRARPLIGSLFTEADEQKQDGGVVVLAESLWRQEFGGDPGAIGRSLRLDGQPYVIVGVLPDALAYPDRQARAYIPFRVPPASGNYLSLFEAVARLRPGVTAAQAEAEGTARGRLAEDTALTTVAIFGGNGPVQIAAIPMREALTAEVRRPLLVLLAAVLLLLLTATANIAGIQLARATTRSHEMAIRAALGAGLARVTRQLLVESALIGLAGAFAGLALAWLLQRAIPAVLPPDFPRAHDVGIDAVVVAGSIAASLATSVICGLLPAWRVRRLDLLHSLADGRNAPAGASAWSRVSRARMTIMAGQVAIACVLLIGASLLGRSFIAMLHAERGYDSSGVLTARVALPASVYTPERRFAIADEILRRLQAVPAGTDVAFTSELPLTPGGSTSALSFQSRERGVISVQASPRIVSPRYFSALGIPLVAGRGFDEGDTATSLPVVVVNEAFARQYLGDSPLGVRLPLGAGYLENPPDAVVIGVVNDIRYPGAASRTQPEIYYCHRQMNGRLPVPVVTLVLRTRGEPAALAPAMRTAVREADGGLVPEAVVPMEERILTSLVRPRLYATLLSGFAALALLVAGVGLFGVLSYSVSQRGRELAVRAALGARRIDLVLLVVRQGLLVAVPGIAAGLVVSALLAGSIRALLYGVAPTDAATYVAVPIVLLVASIAACLEPARRAARLDPARVLRA